MIQIERETGTVTWDSYTLHPHLTHDEFVSRYPSIQRIEYVHVFAGRIYRTYRFPEVNFENYSLVPTIKYKNQWIQYIRFEIERFLFDTTAIDELIGVNKKLSQLFIAQLGQTYSHNLPDILVQGDQSLSDAESQQLKGLKYHFAWGIAGTGCNIDDPFLKFVTAISYDDSQRINTWEKFAAECDLCIQNEQAETGYIDDILAVRQLIDILKPHFDFSELKPYFSKDCITFFGGYSSKRPIIKVHPKDIEKRYEVYLYDTSKRSFIAAGDHMRLIDELRLFSKLENL